MSSGFPMWVLGVILITVGSLGNNLGNNLVCLDHSNRRKFEKKKHISDKLKKEAERKANENQGAINHENKHDENSFCKSIDGQNDIEGNMEIGNMEGKKETTFLPYDTLKSIETDNETFFESELGCNSCEKPLFNGGLTSTLSSGTLETVDEPETKFTSYRVTGTLIFIVGNLFTFGAFGFGAQSLLASLESIQFVSNLFCVKYIHHLPVTSRMIIATLSIIAGNIMVVIFADHAAIVFTSADMIALYKSNHSYWGYLGFAFVVWFITNFVYQHYFHSRYVLRKPLLWQHNFLEPFCYACSAAIIGTQAVLNSKCMAMLIQVAAVGTFNEFTYWYLWMIFGTWLLMVAYWLNRIDTGLKYYPPLFIIPVMQVFFVFFAILCGGIYFEEFDTFSTTQWIGFCIGVAMILAGVYGLAPKDMTLVVPDLDIDETVTDKQESGKLEHDHQVYHERNKLVPFDGEDLEILDRENHFIPLFEVKQKPIPIHTVTSIESLNREVVDLE